MYVQTCIIYSVLFADSGSNYDVLLARVEAYGIQHSEMHNLEWDVQKRAAEVRELQKVIPTFNLNS